MAEATWVNRYELKRARLAEMQAPAAAAFDARAGALPATTSAAASTKPAHVTTPVATATSAALIASAVAAALTAERLRIRAILDSEEAVGRERSAASLAYSGGYSAEEARRLLATLRLDGEIELDAAVAQIAAFQRRRP